MQSICEASVAALAMRCPLYMGYTLAASTTCCNRNNSASSQNRPGRFVWRIQNFGDMGSTLYKRLAFILTRINAPSFSNPATWIVHLPIHIRGLAEHCHRAKDQRLVYSAAQVAMCLCSLIQSRSVKTTPSHPSGSADRIPVGLLRGPRPPSRRTCVPMSNRYTAQTCG